MPPAAAPIGGIDVLSAVAGSLRAAAVERRASDSLQSYLGARDLFLLSSGKAALTVTLEALASIDSRRAVAIPAYTCFTVPAAVVRAGLEPVLVDVDPATMDFDARSLATVMERPDLLAVVPTHLFGIPADVNAVRRAAAGRDIFVVEDAAQALGIATADGRRLGGLGDASILSLARGKHITAGAGGAIATSSPRVADALRARLATVPRAARLGSMKVLVELGVMSAFVHPGLYWLPSGLPFLGLGETRYEPDFGIQGITAAAAGALAGWEYRLERCNAERRACVDAWRTMLGSAVAPVARGPLLRLPVVVGSSPQRSALLAAARERGLGMTAMYPSAVHQIPELRARFAGQRFPGAEVLAERLVTLPTHRYVQPRDQSAVMALWPRADNPAGSIPTAAAPASC